MKAYKTKSKSRVIEFNVEEYSSASELVSVSSSRNIMEHWKSDAVTRQGYIEKDSSWFGCKNYEDALDMLKYGWTEKIETVKSLANKVSTQGTENKRMSFQNSVAGFAPIVPLAIMNVPNSMMDTKIKPIKSKVVRILYNLTMSCGTSAKDILKNGLKVVKAIINLENSGYRCEVMAMQNYYNRNGWCDLLMLKIKDANQPLDLKRVMFPLIHPAMFRVIGFDWQDKLPTGKYMDGRGCGLGYAFDDTPKYIKEAFGDNCFYLDGVLINKHEDDKEYIEKLLKGEIK